MSTQAVVYLHAMRCIFFTVTIVEILPTIVHFKKAFLQVRGEEEEVMICLVRESNLYREDTVIVIALQGEEGKALTKS